MASSDQIILLIWLICLANLSLSSICDFFRSGTFHVQKDCKPCWQSVLLRAWGVTVAPDVWRTYINFLWLILSCLFIILTYSRYENRKYFKMYQMENSWLSSHVLSTCKLSNQYFMNEVGAPYGITVFCRMCFYLGHNVCYSDDGYQTSDTLYHHPKT